MFVQSVVRARSEVEAAWLMFEGKPGTRLIAGGTDLMLQMQRGKLQASSLVDLRRSGMDMLRESDESIDIGATATIASIARHDGVRRLFPDLHRAAATLASQQIRNMGTLGGNIGNASPAADLVPSLLVHEALVRVRCGDALREVPARAFFTGPGETVLTAQELITEVRLPVPRAADGEVHSVFHKLGFRGAQIIAVVNLAARVGLRGDVVEQARLALGSVAPTAVRASHVEQLLIGQRLTRELVEAAAEAVQQDISPIDDLRAPAAYRRRVARNYVRLALSQVVMAHSDARTRRRSRT
ncbi:MAG: xanthine dehydrogenase family protein subunit M [Pseudomonadota bacterium]